MPFLKNSDRYLLSAPNKASSLKELVRRAFWKLISPLPDKPYISLKYWSIFGRLPNLRRPRLFTERLQLRKLQDRDFRLGMLVDKQEAKRFVSMAAGAEYTIPTFWVGTELAGVDWSQIPFPVIVKPTHASGLGKILHGREDVEQLVKTNPGPAWLKTRHHRFNREWAYSQVTPRLLIEELLLDGGDLPTTYRFYVFRGRIALIDLDFIRDGVAYTSVRDADWTHVPLLDKMCDSIDVTDLPRPARLEEMKTVATRLGADFDFVRVDLYAADDWVKFSELTFYPSGGFEVFDPADYDAYLGQCWDEALRPRNPVRPPDAEAPPSAHPLSA